MKSSAVRIRVELFLFFLVLPVSASGICMVRIDCPDQYRGDTVYVPDSVVMMSNVFRHCVRDSIRKVDTVSVFFIIDHSASMSVMDSNSNRYRIVETIIDSLYARNPASEVGIAVFSNQLLHRCTDDPFFVPLDTSRGWPDSYVPLTRLNSSIGAVSAVEKLKRAIALSASPNDTDIGGNRRLVNANFDPTPRKCGWDMLGNPSIGYSGTTDISLGFEAAKHAFARSSIPRFNQSIIFLSDGVSQYVDVERRPQEMEYLSGQGVPATFTVFFINPAQSIPDQILEMNRNIARNGYSAANISGYVVRNQNPNQTMVSQLFHSLRYRKYTPDIGSNPVFMSVNGVEAARILGDSVYFAAPFQLTTPLTRFDMVLIDRNDAIPGIVIDRTVESYFFVKRSNDPPFSGVFTTAIECLDAGRLELLHEGTPVTGIRSGWNDLQVRFYPSIRPVADSAVLVIRNRAGSDSLVVLAVWSGACFQAGFRWEFGSPVSDDVLQIEADDSIVVFAANPRIVLDTLRLAVPVFAASGVRVGSVARSRVSEVRILNSGRVRGVLPIPYSRPVTVEVFSFRGELLDSRRIASGGHAEISIHRRDIGIVRVTAEDGSRHSAKVVTVGR